MNIYNHDSENKLFLEQLNIYSTKCISISNYKDILLPLFILTNKQYKYYSYNLLNKVIENLLPIINN